MVSSKVAEASSKMLQAFSLLLTPDDKCSLVSLQYGSEKLISA